VLLDKIDHGTGLWALVVARAAATLLVVVSALVAGQFRLPARPAFLLATSAGVLDVVCNASSCTPCAPDAVRRQRLTSLYPAATVLMARLVLGERTGTVQRNRPRACGRFCHPDRRRIHCSVTGMIQGARAVKLYVSCHQRGGERFRLWTLSQGKRVGAGERPP